MFDWWIHVNELYELYELYDNHELLMELRNPWQKNSGLCQAEVDESFFVTAGKKGEAGEEEEETKSETFR